MELLDDEDCLPFLHGTLKIHVIEAADLPDTDNAFFNIDRGDYTDPFVIISLGETQILKTAYIPNNLEPRWNEKFSIPVCHRASCLKVMVRDREHIGDQVVGTCLIATEDLLHGEPIEGWYDIIVGANGETHGSIHIMLQFFPVGGLGEDCHFMPESYFEPKMGNDVRLYMTAECPQLPAFEGRDIYYIYVAFFHPIFLSPLISGTSIFLPQRDDIFSFFLYFPRKNILEHPSPLHPL